MCYLFGAKFTMSGPHSYSVRKRKVIGQTGTEDMSLLDVEEFRTCVIDAGARLADLVVVKYPNARLVDDALFGVTEVVECFGLKGQWVPSWATSAHNEFLATDSVCEVSGCVAFIGMTTRFVLFTILFHRLPHISVMRLTLTFGRESRWLAKAY